MTTPTESAVAEQEDADSTSSDDLPPEPEQKIAIGWSAEAVACRGLDLAWLDAHVHAACDALGHAVHRVGISLLDDDGIAELHRRHLDIEGPTDVLTFPGAAPGDPIDVDIAIGVDVAQRAATERGHDLQCEVLLYVVHGLLHACGFDDHDDDDYKRMHEREDEILKSIGVGAVFNTNPEPTS